MRSSTLPAARGRTTGRAVPILGSALLGAAALGGALLAATPALAVAPAAGSSSGTVTAAVAADSWYRPQPSTCTTPAGCAPAVGVPPASQYPADTLHVGVLAGQEEARTYLALDLSAMPFGATVESGTLTLPIGTAAPNGDGTLQAASAKVKVCLSAAKVDDAAKGSIAVPPTLDCSVSAAATMTPAVGTAPAALTVDLSAFAAALSSGSPTALAVLPADGAAQTDAWDLAFSSHSRKGSTVPAPSALLTVTTLAATDTPLVASAPPVAVAVGNGTSFAAPPLQAPAALPVSVGLVAPAAPAIAAGAPTQARASLVPASLVSVGYAYPGVWLLPLVFLAGLAWLGRAMTRELAPALR